jgi:Asp/Glu/hydantoin racemase
MAEAGIDRGAERVTLACKALSAAADDLHLACRRDGVPVDDAAHALEAEAERVCELAEELGKLARKLANGWLMLEQPALQGGSRSAE